jgi:hypothetical protein
MSNLAAALETRPAAYIGVLLALLASSVAVYALARDVTALAWIAPVLVAFYLVIIFWPLNPKSHRTLSTPEKGETRAPALISLVLMLCLAIAVVVTGHRDTEILKVFPMVAMILPAQYLAFFLRELRYRRRDASGDQSAANGTAP